MNMGALDRLLLLGENTTTDSLPTNLLVMALILIFLQAYP